MPNRMIISGIAVYTTTLGGIELASNDPRSESAEVYVSHSAKKIKMPHCIFWALVTGIPAISAACLAGLAINAIMIIKVMMIKTMPHTGIFDMYFSIFSAFIYCTKEI